MSADSKVSDRPFSEAEAALQRRIRTLKRLLDAIEGDPWGEYIVKQIGLPTALAILQNQLKHVRTICPEIGYDGRPPEMREPRDRTAGEVKAGMIGLQNINVDSLEQLANMDEHFESLQRLSKRTDARNEPLIYELQLRAGRRLQNDWRLSKISGSGASLEMRTAGGQGANREPDVRLDAQDRYSKAMIAVGVTGAALLEAIAIDDRTLLEEAAARGWHKKAMIPALRTALDSLVAHYKTKDEERQNGEEAA